MKKNKKYYYSIDILRWISCLAVLLYHLNIIKGGYLAVCTFFVLSGYLSCISACQKESFSLTEYYKNRLKKIYLPLVVVVMITVGIMSYFPPFVWLNLKPETTSVLLGYNNFWQLSANLDYFTRNINSPLIHLWYTSILLQFDLIFPFLYLFFNKVKEKTNKYLPSILTGIAAIISAVFFFSMCLNQKIMPAYYHTLARIFSLLVGMSLGLAHCYGLSFLPTKMTKEKNSKMVFYSYLIILIILFLSIDSKSLFFPFAMILTTVISGRIVEYAQIEKKDQLNLLDKIVKVLANTSYEIYLVQYPILFFVGLTIMNSFLKTSLVFIMTFMSAFLLHFCMEKNWHQKKIIQKVLYGIVLIVALFGFVKYIKTEDPTKEMKQLEEQLLKNEQLLKQKQESYQTKKQQEEQQWMETLKNMDQEQENLNETIKSLPVIGIGDSIMLGAIDSLYNEFPNGYFDAATSRTAWVASSILNNLKNQNLLGNPIIINLGSNGDCSLSCKRNFLEQCRDKDIFWVNVVNDWEVHFNNTLEILSKEYTNLHIVDWNTSSMNHQEYFIKDGIHLTEEGQKAYAKTIYDAIYQVYFQKYQKMKEELIKDRESSLNETIAFYGNDLLLNNVSMLTLNIDNVEFNIKEEYNYDMLKEELDQIKKANKLPGRIVFLFDRTFMLTQNEYKELITLCENQKMYIVSIGNNINNDSKNVEIIDFNKEIENHQAYMMVDGVHLTEEGNRRLSDILIEILTK